MEDYQTGRAGDLQCRASLVIASIMHLSDNIHFQFLDSCTCRHLHQRIEERKGSVIGDHLRNKHGIEPDNITRSFAILRKYKNKLDCLNFEMLFIKELKPTLNKQCDSIRAKLFV